VTVGDIWQFKLFSSLGGKAVLNVFHYETLTETGVVPAVNAAEDFWAHIQAELIPLQSSAVLYSRVEAVNLDELTTFGTFPLTGITGNNPNSYVGTFAAWSFRYNRASLAARHGYKRFAGPTEDLVNNGVPAGPSVTAALDALGAKLGSTLTVALTPSVYTMKPVIRSLILNGQPRPLPVVFDVSSVQFVSFSTQNTRK